MNSLIQKSRYKKLLIGCTAVVFITTLSASAYVFSQGRYPKQLVQTGGTSDVKSEKDTKSGALKTIQPQLLNGSSSVILLGSVLSHETANIYPRRDGIVEDVYVDIGDTVQKNQVVALLLPKGVEGQSAAMIAERQAKKSQAESDLSTADLVAQETIINTQQKIKEKETELMIAEREQEAILQRFAESEAQIMQMQEQAYTSMQSARQLVEWILVGSNSRSVVEIYDYDLLSNLGLQDSTNASRYDASHAYTAFYQAEQMYSSQKDDVTVSLYPLALNALNVTATLLQFTPTQPSGNGLTALSHQQLTERINKLVATKDSIYKAKEKLEDARNSFKTVVAGEPELYAAYKSGNLSGKKSNKVRMLQEQIRTAENALWLTKANQDQIVERQRSMVDIADAALQSEYASTGHRQIRSPFTGIVSKRFIEVGQIVMPSMSAYELTGVPTTLAKNAKTEVKFGLPEQLSSAVDIGDSIAFFLQNNESTVYSAVITRKSPQVDMDTHTITVQAKVPDDISLPHGASVRIRLSDGNKPIFRLPSSAVKRIDDSNYIWIINQDTMDPMQLSVSVIAEDGEFAEVSGFLTVDSEVILDPPFQFYTSN